jgi:hypothetical protein
MRSPIIATDDITGTSLLRSRLPEHRGVEARITPGHTTAIVAPKGFSAEPLKTFAALVEGYRLERGIRPPLVPVPDPDAGDHGAAVVADLQATLKGAIKDPGIAFCVQQMRFNRATIFSLACGGNVYGATLMLALSRLPAFKAALAEHNSSSKKTRTASR